MPISKQKLKEIAMNLPRGVLSNGVSDSAAELLNKLIDKALAAVFPKGASAELASVAQRLSAIPSNRENPLNQSAAADPCVGPIHAIPLRTIKTMIRAQAGDIKIPDETLAKVCGMAKELGAIIMMNAAAEIKDSVALLEAKHIKASMINRANPNSLLSDSLSKVRARRSSSSRKKRRSSSKKRRSSSKKRRSSSKKRSASKKKCGRSKSPVKGFKRDGRSVKAYCRKKSSSR